MTDEPRAPGPPLTADERVSTGTEPEVLATFLDLYRGIVAGKLTGLGEQDARRRLVPSATTLLGLVKHLAAVEREWFGQVLERRSPEPLPGPRPRRTGSTTPSRTIGSGRSRCAGSTCT
jgi:Protein of unknown function (DUF664)